MSRLVALLVFASAGCSSGGPSIVYAPEGKNGASGRFEVRDLPPDDLAATRCQDLVVRVGPGAAILGEHGITGKVLWFRPKYPLAFDLEHVAEFAPAKGAALTHKVTLRRPETPPTSVLAVHPSGEAVPENVLKFYLQFSAPMRAGEAYRRVRVLDAGGSAIELPFLELEQELWDATGTRLTLLIDPGRIKRGLKPREDAGPVFEAGKKYTLEVDADWPDAAGKPLAKGVRRALNVGPAADTRIDVAAWKVTPPKGVSSALEVAFPAPLDAALLVRELGVFDAAGNPVAGKAEPFDGEKGWRFTPSKEWAAGEYRLRVGPDLEDLAGNRVDRVFDADGERGDPDEKFVRERAFRVPAK